MRLAAAVTAKLSASETLSSLLAPRAKIWKRAPSLPGIAAQMEQAIKNIGEVLAAADCRLDDVVKVTTYITPEAYAVDEEAVLAEEIYTRAFSAEPKPARSSPRVALPIPEALISIEAIAVRPTS